MGLASVFLLALLAASVCSDAPRAKTRVVHLKQGAVRGYKEAQDNYYTFFGIPYATAPTGAQKFKAPLPAPRWTTTLKATNRYIMCPQNPLLTTLLKDKDNYFVTENCLTANVYVPDSTDTNLPVVVYIHGGAFQIGFGEMLSHSPLVTTGKVIVVNFNYRLGAHGFLCLGTEDIPGNAGLKDQLAAVRWVKNNILKFGGNPNDITIAGYSAGAVSVSLLMLLPASRGLFNKVIVESGPATTVWGVQLDPIANAKRLASVHNFTNVHDIIALEHFFKTTSLDVLSEDLFFKMRDSTITFVPCVEKTTSRDSVLIDTPMNLLKQGNYEKNPLLIGFANMEGIFRLAVFDEWLSDMNKNFADFLPADLNFTNDEERRNVALQIKQFYFGNNQISTANIQSYVDYFTDAVYAYATVNTVNLYLESGGKNVYLYKYSYVDEQQVFPHNFKGTNHCAQSAAISKNVFDDDLEVPEKYQELKKTMVDLWINFIVTGKPVPEKSSQFPLGWPETSFKNSTYMEINTVLQLKDNLLKSRMEFWHSIYSKYYREPIAPYKPEINTRSEL